MVSVGDNGCWHTVSGEGVCKPGEAGAIDHELLLRIIRSFLSTCRSSDLGNFSPCLTWARPASHWLTLPHVGLNCLTLVCAASNSLTLAPNASHLASRFLMLFHNGSYYVTLAHTSSHWLTLPHNSRPVAPTAVVGSTTTVTDVLQANLDMYERALDKELHDSPEKMSIA